VRDGFYSWYVAMRGIWENLLAVAFLNLMWLAASLPIITIGPATLAAYWYAARVLRDNDFEPNPGLYFRVVWQLLPRGLAWGAIWLAVLFIAYSNLVLWPQVLPPVGAFAVRGLVIYLVYLWAAAQPSLMEGLAVEGLGLRQALAKAGFEVLANPAFTHVQPLLLFFAAYIGAQFQSFIFLVLIAIILYFAAVAADLMPRKYPASFGPAEGAT
jgi:hypothetical protein